jgi:hypothetical protein
MSGYMYNNLQGKGLDPIHIHSKVSDPFLSTDNKKLVAGRKKTQIQNSIKWLNSG